MFLMMKQSKEIFIVPLQGFLYARLCKAIMQLSSLMGRQERVKPTQCKDLNTICMTNKEELFLALLRIYSNIFRDVKINKQSLW